MTPSPFENGAEIRQSEYRQFMIREVLIWMIGVPVPIAAVIGFFVL